MLVFSCVKSVCSLHAKRVQVLWTTLSSHTKPVHTSVPGRRLNGIDMSSGVFIFGLQYCLFLLVVRIELRFYVGYTIGYFFKCVF